MVNILEKEFGEFLRESMESEVSIVYKKEPGMDGNTALQASGLGSMLFDGVCTILKELAIAEARRAGSPEMAAEYVQIVCSMVTSEMEGLQWMEC